MNENSWTLFTTIELSGTGAALNLKTGIRRAMLWVVIARLAGGVDVKVATTRYETVRSALSR